MLERAIEDLFTRPRGRTSHAPLIRYRSVQYEAASWNRPRRVIAKVKHQLGELFPRVGFIITTLTASNRAVVRFYNQRGTAEQWIKEGKEATDWTRLSCHRPMRSACSSVSSPTISAISCAGKTGGRLIRRARYFMLQLAESHLTARLFRHILGRIERLAWHPT